MVNHRAHPGYYRSSHLINFMSETFLSFQFGLNFDLCCLYHHSWLTSNVDTLEFCSCFFSSLWFGALSHALIRLCPCDVLHLNPRRMGREDCEEALSFLQQVFSELLRKASTFCAKAYCRPRVVRGFYEWLG